MGTRKIAKEAVLLSFPLVTSNPFFAKSPLGGSIMLSKPPTSSTTSFPTLSHPKQSGMCSKRTISALLSRRNAPYSKGSIVLIASNLPSTMKTGQWRIGKGSFGQMRLKSTGLGQMEGSIPGSKGENHFQIGSPPLLSSMEEGIILWYGGAWAGMGWGS